MSSRAPLSPPPSVALAAPVRLYLPFGGLSLELGSLLELERRPCQLRSDEGGLRVSDERVQFTRDTLRSRLLGLRTLHGSRRRARRRRQAHDGSNIRGRHDDRKWIGSGNVLWWSLGSGPADGTPRGPLPLPPHSPPPTISPSLLPSPFHLPRLPTLHNGSYSTVLRWRKLQGTPLSVLCGDERARADLSPSFLSPRPTSSTLL